MSQIYSKAERSIAWLGEDKDLGASCLADINGAVPYLPFFTEDWATKDSQSSFGMNKNSIITLLRDDALAPSQAMSKLLRRPWFSRMWIQQEVALAKDIWIYCGSQSTTWSAFSSVLKALKMKSKLSKDFRAASNLATFRHQYQKNRDSGGVDIHTAMVQARQCDATDMRDKVYALLGVCPELARFVGEPDYKLEVWVIWARAQRAYLASLSINALSLVSVGGGVRDDLPSWVPDLRTGARTWPRRPPSPAPTDGKAKILQCSGNSDSCLHIWGTFVDTVAHNYGQTENSSVEEMLAQCRNWWIHLLQMQVNSGTILSDGIVAFWSTLYCDVNNSIPRSTDNARLQEWHSRVIRLDSTDGEGAESIHNAEEDALPGVRVLDFLESTSNKVFGATEECTIGLFPSEAQIGDRVVLFVGGTIPYLIRPTSRSFHNACFRRSAAIYRLIEPCYVYGLTDVAARAKHLSNAQEISLS